MTEATVNPSVGEHPTVQTSIWGCLKVKLEKLILCVGTEGR